MRFEELSLSREIIKAVADMGFEEATPIQALAIPELLAGHDIIGQAQTGTGKTAAFGIPLLERIDTQSKKVQAIVLCPTRELAIQVAEELTTLAARKKGLFILPVYGGQPMDRQLRALARGVQLVVGTPGRVLDHLERRTLNLSNLTMAVLDEADEMLDMGFREDMEAILSNAPATCQRALFSATMPPAILEMTRRFLRDPKELKIAAKRLTVPSVEQFWFDVRQHQKLDALCRILDAYNPHRAIIFCSTKHGVDELAGHLQARGCQADGLHGNLSQSQRDRVMTRFRSGSLEQLIATDVAARGLDVDDVDVVINYDIPNGAETYVHRIGRTGRAGKTGKALTFITPREGFALREIMKRTKAEITQAQIPSRIDVLGIKTTQLLDSVRDVMEEGILARQIPLVEELMTNDSTSLDVAAAILKVLMHRELGDIEAMEREQERERSREHDRGPRGERGERGDRGPQRTLKGPVARLFLNLGSKAKISPKDIVGAITGETGLPGRIIGGIEIRDRFSFVDVPEEHAQKIIDAMNGSQIRGCRLGIDRATPK